MPESISKDEYKILKVFMKNPTFTMSQSEYDKYYPHNSEIRISAVRLYKELKMIEYTPILNESGDIAGYKDDELRITAKGRYAYKLYKEQRKSEFYSFFAKSILTPIIVSLATTLLARNFSQIASFVSKALSLAAQYLSSLA